MSIDDNKRRFVDVPLTRSLRTHTHTHTRNHSRRSKNKCVRVRMERMGASSGVPSSLHARNESIGLPACTRGAYTLLQLRHRSLVVNVLSKIEAG